MAIQIIAEAGVNHNGDLKLAERLVDAAATAGADRVKFQTFVASNLTSVHASKADYQLRTTDASESQFQMLQRLELTREAHIALIHRCSVRGIGFLSTPFDQSSLNLLLELGIDAIKIPSGEITNLPALRRIGGLGLPVLMSTGMATLGEIEAALFVLESAGTPRTSITVLQCTTEYPTPMAEVNLRAMHTIREAFGVAVGYSDHTAGIEVAIAAAALGASVIEKHFTLDRNLPGPDHKASLEPGELHAMVNAIRNIEAAMGDGIKRPGPSEQRNMTVARKSLVASRLIRAGDPFTAENISVKRPGHGLSPMRWDEFIGRRATRDFAPDELIEP